MKLFFDGGCQPNPGMMEVCVVAGGQVFHEPNLGHGTNNAAEWIALIYCLKIARSLGLTDLDIKGDSALVINQANGDWKCRSDELKPFLEEYNEERKSFSSIKLKHVRRHLNLAGIAIEKIHGEK